ncbi:MAG: C40 family peptidase [Endomicrobia bacterium]|nr:C40 family peptidase [Endomicrobiia bacterium]
MKKIFLTLFFSFLFVCSFCYDNYYIRIDCEDVESLYEVLKSQSWFEEKKVYVFDSRIQLGPYNLQEAKEIHNILYLELNIPSYIESGIPDEMIEDIEQNGFHYIVESSYTKYVSKDILEYYDDENIRKIINYALELYTLPYKWGGTDIEKGIDCSYFVKYIFSRIGIELPRTSKEQFKVGIEISKDELRCGDLVFFKKTKYKKVKGKIKKYEYINHVGIYLKDNEFIHAARGCKRVTISSLCEPYYSKHFAGARRVINSKKN